MKLFRRYVLGGTSDKTEGTLLAFLVGVVWVTWIIWKVSQGVDMSSVIGLAGTYIVTTVAAFTGAAVVGHFKPPARPDVAVRSGSDGYPAGDWPQYPASCSGGGRPGDGL